MSTVKAINFQHPSASAANITLASDGTVSGGIPSPNRNLLYNGACQIAQRSTSVASITTGGYYTADRWILHPSGLGTWTNSVENDAPTGSGLSKSFKILCTTAKTPGAADWGQVYQTLEGQDLQRIAKGTASAQQLTLSFWVKSNVTGTYIAELYDNDNTRQVSAAYTISASGTWEKKTITLPADTTGAFDNDNAASLYTVFWIGAGSDRSSGTLNTAWASSVTANRAVGQTNLAASTNNYWQVTGVQLEVGPVATSFEFKSYGQELRECQRYYFRKSGGVYGRFASGFNNTTTTNSAVIQHPVVMRAAPTSIDTTATASNYALFHASGTLTACSALPTINPDGGDSMSTTLIGTVASGLTGGNPSQLIANNTLAAYIGLSAEL